MSASELVSTNPCTGEVVWRGEQTHRGSLDRLFRKARLSFAAWSQAGLDHRFAIGRRFAEIVRERRGEIASLIARETGKPLWEALTEADSVAGKIEISIAALVERSPERTSEADGLRTRLRHRPHGVAVVLGPYNFPMHLPNGHIAPALLAGDVVIFKPSEKTPASGLLLAELWHAAGAPDSVLQVALGGGDLGEALIRHDDGDAVLFTGGAHTGLAIHRALADAPHKLVALELGGNNPLVVWDTADAEIAAHTIVQSAFISAGQRCSCARRLIVPTGAAGDAIVDALIATIDRLRIGAPFNEPAPYMGPLIDRRAADGLVSAQRRMIADGGTAIRVLKYLGNDAPFLTPGLIDMTHGAARDEEHFGPLLQLYRAPDFTCALRRANETRFGLAAGLVSDDGALYDRFWTAMRAGVINWNRPTTGASSAAPFGGVGLSGNHRPSAYYAADYCAYPVASLEQAKPAFQITTGLAA
jgi:succinylglutamic semialdehyde dehydrogenase